MAEQRNTNKVVRELKQLDAKEPDPSLLNIRELRGRNVNEDYAHAPLDSHPRTQYVCIVISCCM